MVLRRNPVFDPNTIYNKWITGIGGTTTAINEGYTIIISPNVAGIVSKEGIGNVIAVYGGIGPETVARRVQEIEEQGLRPRHHLTPGQFLESGRRIRAGHLSPFQMRNRRNPLFQEAASYPGQPSGIYRHVLQVLQTKSGYYSDFNPAFASALPRNGRRCALFRIREQTQPLQVYYSTNQLFASVTEFVESLPTEDKKNRILQHA